MADITDVAFEVSDINRVEANLQVREIAVDDGFPISQTPHPKKKTSHKMKMGMRKLTMVTQSLMSASVS